ncbi:MAG TPA: HD domain-containing phosphohydrolase [Candidatus Dormibacteraeota bacterium]
MAELLAGLSLVTDLAARHASEQALKASILATRLAESTGLRGEEAKHAFYATLLRFVGCTAPMPEYADVMGEVDNEMRPRGDMTDLTNPRESFPFLLSLGQSVSAWRRPALWAGVLTKGRTVAGPGIQADCEVAIRMAERFHLNRAVADALSAHFERWDGHGLPRGLSGEAIPLPARVAAVAFAAAMFHEAGGKEVAVEAMRRWSGRILDPTLVDGFLAASGELLQAVETRDAWQDALNSEPAPRELVPEHRLDAVLQGFADFVDLKSRYFHGHSSGVAALAAAAGRTLGLADNAALTLRRAGLVHDIGRAAVGTTTWDRPGPLRTAEWEQVRLHAYHGERVLTRSQVLAPLAPIAGMHHERLDGSGYHRGAPAAMQPKLARVLAVADVYRALTEDRPHRQALGPDAAARVLEAQPGLDKEVVSAVLEAAGHQARRPKDAWPAGLSDREVEVLRLLARGRSEPQIAQALFISPATVHTHVTHIYQKTEVTTRAGAALFAMEHGLLEI